MTAIKHKKNVIECGFENNVMTNRNKVDNFENIKTTVVYGPISTTRTDRINLTSETLINFKYLYISPISVFERNF